MSHPAIPNECHQLFVLLAQGLYEFVLDKLQETLGSEDWKFFVSSPPPWSTEYTLKVILDRWFAIFSDTCLEQVMVPSLGKGKQVFSWLYTMRMDFLQGKNFSIDQLQLLNQAIKEVFIAIRSPLASLLQTSTDSNEELVSSQEQCMEIDKIIIPSSCHEQDTAIGDDIWSNWRIKPFMVLDGANIAWSHGKNRKFSALGIVLAMEFFRQRGLECVCFLPETYWRPCASESWIWTNLASWRDNNQLILTPANDYDDTYMLYYAQKHGGLIVSNDRFLDHMEQTCVDWKKRSLAKWLLHCRVTFVFRQDEFIPNPSFHVTAAQEYLRDASLNS